MHLSYPLMSVLRRINEVLPQFIQSLLGKIILFMKKEWREWGRGGEIDILLAQYSIDPTTKRYLEPGT